MKYKIKEYINDWGNPYFKVYKKILFMWWNITGIASTIEEAEGYIRKDIRNSNRPKPTTTYYKVSELGDLTQMEISK